MLNKNNLDVKNVFPNMETRKKQEKYSCSICAFTTVRKSNFGRHLLSLTHKKEQEKKENYSCSICQFSTVRKSNYDRHLLSLTHKKEQEKQPCQCSHCGKKYETRTGLWKHSQHCLISMMTAQTEMIQSLQEQVKGLKPVHVSIFLKDSCKDAMNWLDFLKCIQIEDKPILETIQEQLLQLGYKRPVHVFPSQTYIKHENVWKDDPPTLNMAMTTLNEHVQQKQLESLQQWEKGHPEWYLNAIETDVYTNKANVLTIPNLKFIPPTIV